MGTKSLKAQDLLVLLKLVTVGYKPWRISDLAESLDMSTSEVLHALKRSQKVGLLSSDQRRVNIESLLELLSHAVKYFFPGQFEKSTRSSLQPLYPSAPYAASQDRDLDVLLTLVDLVRCENLGYREKAMAELELKIKDLHAKHVAHPEEEVVLANLSDLGAPLVLSPKSAGVKTTLSSEETLAFALTLSHRNPTLTRILPLVFFKQIDRLNFRKLRRLAQNFHEESTLGFFLELASELSHEQRLHFYAKPLKKMCSQMHFPMHSNVEADFFVFKSRGKYADRLAGTKTPRVAKDWGFKMNMGLDTFRSHFEKFI